MPQTASKPKEKFSFKNTVLLVDDDRVLRLLMAEQLDQLGYNVIEAENGQMAHELLHQYIAMISVIILDREMPVMDGMAFIAKLKQDEKLRDKIVVMSTGHSNPDQISEGVTAGVFYYLVKPVNYTVLDTVLHAAFEEATYREKIDNLGRKQETGFALLTEGHFTIATIAEARVLAKLLSSCFKQPGRIVTGIEALLTNSIEHGHLGIGAELKQTLVANGSWLEEIQRREILPENQVKKMTVRYQKIQDKQILLIKDQGYGFNWQKYLQSSTDQKNHLDGKGIFEARHNSFDELTFNAAGNQVIAVVYNRE